MNQAGWMWSAGSSSGMAADESLARELAAASLEVGGTATVAFVRLGLDENLEPAYKPAGAAFTGRRDENGTVTWTNLPGNRDGSVMTVVP